MTKSNNIIAAKRVAIAVAAVCASLAMPAVAADSKALLDLMLKKGVITQAEYDQFAEAAENESFKEKRLSDDVTKLNKIAEKTKDAGMVTKSGLGVQSADGSTVAEFTGRIHMDYRNFTQSGRADNDTNGNSLRRARFGVKGKVAKDFDYLLLADFSPEKDGNIDEGYITYNASNEAKVRVGKFKMPFSLEQLTSSNNIDFMERSLVGSVEGDFIPAKQVGAMLFGNPTTATSYALAMYAGNTKTSKSITSNSNKDSTYDRPDFVGRLTANVAEMAGNKDLVAHLGLGYGISTTKAIAADGIEATSEGKGDKVFKSQAVAAGTDVTRIGFEGALAYEAYKLQGEYFDFKFAQPGGTNLRANGLYVEALWNLTGEKHNYSNSSGTFGWIKPKTKFSLADGGLGAWQVGVRYSLVDGSGTNGLGKSGDDKADATTVGLSWFMNDNARLMLNWVGTTYHDKAYKETAVNVRAQLWF